MLTVFPKVEKHWIAARLTKHANWCRKHKLWPNSWPHTKAIKQN